MKYLIFVLILSGCSTNASVIRIVEYRADTTLAAISGSGIAVHQSGGEHQFARVKIEYQAERGTVTIDSGK